MRLSDEQMAMALMQLRSELTTGRYTAFCLQQGFLPVPIHFYHPIPDVGDLVERDVWATCSELPGVDFRADDQKDLLLSLGAQFGDECAWPATVDAESNGFFTDNGSFSFGCAGSTHMMVRHHRPRHVIEIGSGMSSRVIAKALELNGAGEHTIVDPYPVEAAVTRGVGERTTLVKERVELLEPSFFDKLGSGDILFIDSGHVVRIGGDVNFLFLEVIPRLQPGVVVHVHDIPMPDEYPRSYATSSTPMFWTEQYLLKAFLAFNSEFEVLLAMAFLQSRHLDVFRRAFPHYDPAADKLGSGSFWMRRRT
ncbi:MAG: class I SAM-dependent methyltransferase [Coriobacteriia bacterium]